MILSAFLFSTLVMQNIYVGSEISQMEESLRWKTGEKMEIVNGFPLASPVPFVEGRLNDYKKINLDHAGYTAEHVSKFIESRERNQLLKDLYYKYMSSRTFTMTEATYYNEELILDFLEWADKPMRILKAFSLVFAGQKSQLDWNAESLLSKLPIEATEEEKAEMIKKGASNAILEMNWTRQGVDSVPYGLFSRKFTFQE